MSDDPHLLATLIGELIDDVTGDLDLVIWDRYKADATFPLAERLAEHLVLRADVRGIISALCEYIASEDEMSDQIEVGALAEALADLYRPCVCGHHAEVHDLRSDGYEVCEAQGCMCMDYEPDLSLGNSPVPQSFSRAWKTDDRR